MILGRDILTDLRPNLKYYGHVAESNDGNFKGLMSPMVDMSTYGFKYLNTGNITPQ